MSKPDFSSWLAKPEDACVEALLSALEWEAARAARVTQAATARIESIRAGGVKSGSLESFFQQYKLNTDEGLALMTLAEALLRIPDGPTADELLRDKLANTNWLSTMAQSKDVVTRMAALGLAAGSSTVSGMFKRLGTPVVRQGAAQAMKYLGGQFVLGQTINDAMTQAKKLQPKGYEFSFDMLGEGARTHEDAERYFASYKNAIAQITGEGLGISVKLSALHPRYSVAQQDLCVPALLEKLKELCVMAAAKNMPLTVDAEEVARLDISLDIILGVAADPAFAHWNGFGLAVQAYQKRALPLIEYLIEFARAQNKIMQIRLVKGAYWDGEIKRAQMEGLEDYALFTRKMNTDLSYLACAQKLLAARDVIRPLFGTHNAYTVEAILDMAGTSRQGFSFQKLFGMGDALYERVIETQNVPVSIYAPVGVHQDLLPYLVRRMLENGANSSFVNKIYDENLPPSALAQNLIAQVQATTPHTHPGLPKPRTLFADRKNSQGIDLSDEPTVEKLLGDMRGILAAASFNATALIGGKPHETGDYFDVLNPAATQEKIGRVCHADSGLIDKAFVIAQKGWSEWSHVSADQRAAILDKIADTLEDQTPKFMALAIKEAGKTIPDALAEVREAVDFCRYYAAQGRLNFNESGTLMPGYTGEENRLRLDSRGVFVCISPWNFPLAIFTGQITAALMAGNAVIAKPAEQTPLIAFEMVKLMLACGVPDNALALLPGDGRLGAALVQHPAVAGVAFTGSIEAAWSINRTLAAKDGPIVPLIAETGGQNALIADSSALTEQVIDDVILGAFGSTGQRCSATRVLFIQDDVADKTMAMLKGAMAELRVGDPMMLSTDIGPVIDEAALSMLKNHQMRLEEFGKKIAQAPLEQHIAVQGNFFAPIAYEIDSLNKLQKEIFGPALHVIRFEGKRLSEVFDAINQSGYGLTFGLHTRLSSVMRAASQHMRAGNIYVNRSTIGAIVGVQPFGGRGLSGTGPKAGGPHYLSRFATETHICTNTTAAGGNTSLVMLED